MTTPAPAMTPDEIRRLAFIEYLYRVAVEQSRQTQPMEEFRSSVTGFFTDAASLVFSLAFSDISMVHLVRHDEARSRLEEAQRLMSTGSYNDALEQIALAFDRLLTDHELLDFPSRIDSPYDFGIPQLDGFIHHRVQAALHQLGTAVRILGFGLDYKRYTKFRILVSQFAGWYGDEQVDFRPFGPPPPEAECRFCFDFVIDSALRLQEFDFDAR